MRASSVVLALALVAPLFYASAQQTGVVAGRIADSVSGEPRRGALVSLAAQTVSTNGDGRFIIARIPAGEHVVSVRAIGSRSVTRTIIVRAGDTTRVDIVMARDPLMLDAIRTDAPFAEREAFESKPNVGAVMLTARAMESVPRLGEADVVRVVQLLPGVQAKNDFSTGFSVRGGESDQNLVLLDGYPIYNPFHVGGLFSTFISSSVRDIQLLTGGFPARYGDRLSSVLDVRSADETRPGIHGTTDVSVLAAATTVGGSFDSGNGSWTLAGRRTYADQVIQLVSSERVPYHFRDEQAHIVYRLPGDVHLAASFYDGRDVLDASFAELPDSLHQGADGGAFLVSWGNAVGGVTLSKTLRGSPRLPLLGWRLGDSATMEQRISTSRFSTLLDVGSGSATYANAITDNRLGGSVTAFTSRHDRTLGYEVASYDVRYHLTQGQGSVDDHAARQQPTVAAAYYDDLWRAAPSLLVSAGARFEMETGRHSSSALPRVSLKYLSSPNSAFTAAAGRYSQSLHSLALEDSPIRLFDLWRSSDSVTPVSTAWQFVAGHERWLSGSRFVRVEAFYKRYERLLEYNVQEDPRVEGDEFTAANGVSYGADLLLRQFDAGPFSGWLAYTFTVGTRQQGSVHYAPANDRRHDLNLVGSWRIAKYVAGLRVAFASGLPYTEIVGEVPRRTFDPVRGTWGSSGGRAWFEDVGSVRNGARLPATQRIDVFVERRFQVRGASVTPYASVVNASNAKNVLFYVYDFATTPGTRRTVSQFPVLPSAGVSIAF
jgi:hypothetical protein